MLKEADKLLNKGRFFPKSSGYKWESLADVRRAQNVFSCQRKEKVLQMRLSLKSEHEGNIHGRSGLAGGLQGATADPREAPLPPLLLGGDEPSHQQHEGRHHLRPQR